MYCAPTVTKFVRSLRSVFADAGALVVPDQLRYWSWKSYSTQSWPPVPLGRSEGVPTSKTPQPQAQGHAERGTRNTHRTAVRSSPVARPQPQAETGFGLAH